MLRESNHFIRLLKTFSELEWYNKYLSRTKSMYFNVYYIDIDLVLDFSLFKCIYSMASYPWTTNISNNHRLLYLAVKEKTIEYYTLSISDP